MIDPLYRNAGVPIEDRVQDLIGRMSLDEKLAQLGCIWSTAVLRDGVFERCADMMWCVYGVNNGRRRFNDDQRREKNRESPFLRA